MTDAPADRARQQRIFDDIMKRCGGADRLSPLDIEIATLATSLLAAAQDRPDDLATTSATIEKLLSKLPVADDASPAWDLRRLSDEQLNALAVIEGIATGTAPAGPLLPTLPERQPGRNEQAAASRVPEPCLHRLGILTGVDQERRRGMPPAMRWLRCDDLGLAHDLTQPDCHIHRQHRLAAPAREAVERVARVALAPGQRGFKDVRLLHAHQFGNCTGDADGSPAGVAFRLLALCAFCCCILYLALLAVLRTRLAIRT